MRPWLPSATTPCSPRNARAAFKLCRVVEWPHATSRESSAFRLMGRPADRRAAWMYSIVSKVGFARYRANRGVGAFRDCAIDPYHGYMEYMYPCRWMDRVGFEPTASPMPRERSSRLIYRPKGVKSGWRASEGSPPHKGFLLGRVAALSPDPTCTL